jgi:hypothetical protein
MAAASSSSCEVVDLGLAATCDDATSHLFFSKGGGGDLSWPAAAEISSALTNQKSLVALCDKYGVPGELKPVRAVSLRCAACETPPKGSNALCIYSDALEAGLRFPLHDFYLKLLRHYRLAPSQLVPNAWKYMAAFVLRCKDAGVAGIRLQILLLPVRSLQVQAQGQANGSGVAPFPALRRPSPPLLRRYAHQVRLENKVLLP